MGFESLFTQTRRNLIMKYIITEEQNIKRKIIRRIDEIWELIQNLYPWIYPCDYQDLKTFTIAIRVEMFEITTLDWFTKENEEYVWEIVQNVYGDKLKEHYEGWCKNK